MRWDGPIINYFGTNPVRLDHAWIETIEKVASYLTANTPHADFKEFFDATSPPFDQLPTALRSLGPELLS